MSDRLTAAIARARARRSGTRPAEPRPERARAAAPPEAWETLPKIEPDAATLLRERVVTRDKSDPSHAVFDTLRTRLGPMALDQGIRRIGITSPTQGCGKTVLAANLAFSFARMPQMRVVMVDLDMRIPRLSRILGLHDRRALRWLLEGRVPPEQFLLRAGPRLAVALNGQRMRNSAELLQTDSARDALARIDELLRPDLMILDLPPVLVGDEALSCLAHVDAAILVAGAGQTLPEEIEECEGLIGEETRFLGVVLNRADPALDGGYGYGYAYGYGADEDEPWDSARDER